MTTLLYSIYYLSPVTVHIGQYECVNVCIYFCKNAINWSKVAAKTLWFKVSCFPQNYCTKNVSKNRKSQNIKHNKSSLYDLCSLFSVFQSYTIALCEDQTKIKEYFRIIFTWYVEKMSVNILQGFSFCVSQKTESNLCLEQHDGGKIMTDISFLGYSFIKSLNVSMSHSVSVFIRYSRRLDEQKGISLSWRESQMQWWPFSEF